MKANQFVKNNEAVSPVIGVILMVAITVVLAALVFVLVSNIASKNTKTGEYLTVNNSSSGRTTLVFTVLQTSDSLTWSNLIIKNGAGATVAYTTSSIGNVSAGDVITITGLTANTPYSFSLVYTGVLISTVNGHTTN